MDARILKDTLYEQVARIGKVVASPKRLELIEILCQGEKCVDDLARDAQISIKLASAHLKALRTAQLVRSRREGKRIVYCLADQNVAGLWIVLRGLAEERLTALRTAMAEAVAHPDELAPVTSSELLAQAARGDVWVIDVRPESEYVHAHLPYARSIPVHELRRRMHEIPPGQPVVAYCRGPFCFMAKEAVEILRAEGLDATRLEDGVAEWRAKGLPLVVAAG